ncbi:MAG: aminoacetone oxidase family FAD-binding enzyme [Elusimicrobiaceae bacterium]|nr:aminoacetone oxidase family FAD-binding enzyme [Elusimicrobiaceae bacterium]
MLTYHTAIIGAGASGLFCAGSFSRSKIILDHNPRPGVKVKISGGGKCNFTNRNVTACDYDSQNKHFCKSALAAFGPQHFVGLLQHAHIPYEERTHGQLFAKSAQDIVDFLVQRAKAAHTDIALNTQVLDVTPGTDGFLIRTSTGTIRAEQVVLACGGLSYPALGASSLGPQLARKLNLNLIAQRPALCGLSWPKQLRPLCKLLAGNSTLAQVKTGKHSFTEQLLFTHEGISGPAVLPVSLFYKEGESVTVNFLPGTSVRELFSVHKNTTRKMSAVLPLPGKMAGVLLGVLDKPLANATKSELESAIRQLEQFTFIPAGTAGYTRAEVTAGGIDTRQINPSTFEVKTIPGLFVIGELLDVTGRLGGYNLQWAWSSGWCAAQALAKKI